MSEQNPNPSEEEQTGADVGGDVGTETTTTQATSLPGDADCKLDRFVRNRYFHGKLMTARDMQLEQAYHTDRLETLAQHVTGKGAVCGLATSLSQENTSSALEVTVEPGYALDCCGRPVLLDGTGRETFPPEELPDPSASGDGDDLPPGVAVYIRLVECYTEKVPVAGSEDACREDCTYNRVVEDYEIVIDLDAPDIKEVRDVEFPGVGDFADPDAVAETDPALHQPAQSYYEDPDRAGFQQRPCHQDGDPRVFLGYFTRSGADWELVEELAPRHHVYTNDMLYAAVVRHATDFGNPHDNVERVEGLSGEVDLTSPDDTIAISTDAANNAVELQTTAGDQAVIDRYMADRALKTAVKSYSFMGLWFSSLAQAGDVEYESELMRLYRDALTVAARGRDAIANRAYESEAEFYDAVRDIANLTEPILRNKGLIFHAIDESVQRLQEEFDEVTAYTDSMPDSPSNIAVADYDMTEVAYDLDQLAEAAQWVTHLDGEFSVSDTATLPFYIWMPLVLDFDVSYIQQLVGGGLGDGQTTAPSMEGITDARMAETINTASFTGDFAAKMGTYLESDIDPVVRTFEANKDRYVVDVVDPKTMEGDVKTNTIISHGVETVDDGQQYRVTVAGTPIEQVAEVGDQRKTQLATANLYTAESLATADEQTVATAIGVDTGDSDLARTLIENAKQTIGSR